VLVIADLPGVRSIDEYAEGECGVAGGLALAKPDKGHRVGNGTCPLHPWKPPAKVSAIAVDKGEGFVGVAFFEQAKFNVGANRDSRESGWAHAFRVPRSRRRPPGWKLSPVVWYNHQTRLYRVRKDAVAAFLPISFQPR
jgi:hypothetical protein